MPKTTVSRAVSVDRPSQRPAESGYAAAGRLDFERQLRGLAELRAAAAFQAFVDAVARRSAPDARQATQGGLRAAGRCR